MPAGRDPGSLAALAAPANAMACSAAQRRLWILDQLDPGTPALNLAARWRLDGPVSSVRLQCAFATIVDRHPALRTGFVRGDGAPERIVSPHLQFPITLIDLSRRAPAEAEAEAERLAQLEARAPFDLSVPPLLRVTHLRVGASHSVLLVTAHRLVCDQRSLGLIARELGALCAELRTDSLPALPVPAANKAEAAATPPADAVADAAFWANALRGARPTELMSDRPRPAAQTAGGRIVSRPMERALAQGLHQRTLEHGSTLFVTALTALMALLHRYSGETDIVVASEVPGRDALAAEDLIGGFERPVVLRCDLADDPPLSTLQSRVQASAAGAFAHAGVALDELVMLLKPAPDLSRKALCTINFGVQRAFIGNGSYGEFQLTELPPVCAGTRYDLDFLVAERGEDWTVSCEYNSDLYEEATVARLLGYFASLLQAVTSDPAQPVASVALLGAAEHEQLVVARNRTEALYPQRMSVAELFDQQALQSPDAVAAVCGDRALTYRQLEQAANRLAHELRARGLAPATCIAVCLGRSTDLVIALLAILKSGSAYLPLDPSYPPARIAQILGDARPGALITTAALQEHLPPLLDVPRVLLDTDAPAIAARPAEAPAPGTQPEDLAYVIYTSGSTGVPKGVRIRQRALVNLLWAMRQQPGLTAQDTLLAVTTVSFDIAALEIFLPLITGAKLVLAREAEAADGAALLQLLRQNRVTVMQATPVSWQLLLEAGWCGDPALKMLCGGEALSRPLADRLLACGGELWNLYGPTETTIWSSALRVTPGVGTVGLGPPIANTQFYVLDARGQLVPPGAPGELFIGGDGVAAGYLNLPEKTAERFVPDLFRASASALLYRTGDRVRQRHDGGLEYLGRGDQQIKLRGFRIELGEIEAVLASHPLILEAAALVDVDASGNGTLRAYVVARADTPAAYGALVEALRARAREALPAYMCPASIAILASLPRTPNGKLDRAALPALAAPVPLPEHAAAVVPLNPVERRLAAIWTDLLGNTGIYGDTNFFEIGGHSLQAVRLLARIETEFGHKLRLSALFEKPTLAAQAQLLTGSDPREYDFRQVVQLRAGGTRPLLLALNNTGIYYALSRRLGTDQPFTTLQLFDPSADNATLPQSFEEIAAAYVQLILKVQPRGPYSLLGWCVAGALAFETARQLRNSGHEVAHLMLVDTYAPGWLERLPRLRARLAGYSYRWQLIARDWARVTAGRQSLGAFLAQRVIVQRLLRWIGWRAATAAAAPRPESVEMYDQWLLGYLEESASRYRPRSYPGRLTLFRSSEEPQGRFLDPAMGWGAFAAGGLDIVVLEGDHFSIFQDPGVNQIARAIAAMFAGRAARAPAERVTGAMPATEWAP